MTAIELVDATVAFDHRTLWSDLTLAVEPGEFVAVLGPNGSGKTTLLQVLLGRTPLSRGTAKIYGTEVSLGNEAVGYIPQQQRIDRTLPLRGRDLLALGVDGHRWGLGLRNRKRRRETVDNALDQVSGQRLADQPFGTLSGGEQQRLRVAQALVGNPSVLLCDEPLLSLDLANQRLVAGLINQRRRQFDTAVVFVTHEINPILQYVDRILYLVEGRYRIGSVADVMTSATLSELYQTDVDVLRVRDRLIVVGSGDAVDALGHIDSHSHGVDP